MSLAEADVPLVELWRGGRLESVHRGHAVVVNGAGEVVESWGDPALVTYPRSSAKMLQALPLVESGAADAAGLSPRQLSLACASHKGAPYHTKAVTEWLAELGLGEADLRCGAHEPADREGRDGLIRAGDEPDQRHNNCSGKHTGFLTLNRHLGGGPEYIDIHHPVQRAVRAAWEECCEEDSPGFGIDGCSAPNFATSLTGMARAMAGFATAAGRPGARAAAQVRLVEAMIAHPEMVRADGGSCTEIMRACGGAAAVKGGAEGFYAAILPGLGLGVALKISDGTDRAKNIAIAAILRRLGVLPDEPKVVERFVERPLRNWAGAEVGRIRPAPGLA